MDQERYQSWGRYPRVTQEVFEPAWLSDVVIPAGEKSILAYGQGRSYGDCGLNDGGQIISTRWLDRLMHFDSSTGILRCEAGATLQQILRLIVPRGWFLPVSPGTQFVSIGGAVANDVHGKNHHRSGTFGSHVRRLELLRSDGKTIECSPQQNGDLFSATIGGLGLTGFIRWAEIQLKPVAGPFIDVESIKFRSLDEFFEISEDSDKTFEYTVAWLDCIASGEQFGRGIFLRGNHSELKKNHVRADRGPIASVPFDMPGIALSPLTMRAFNMAYYGKQQARSKKFVSHYAPFFYPLDTVGNWNRLYGKRGFFQYQCVVPADNGNRAIREILQVIVSSGRASFLAVLKEFGEIASPGLLSFPRKGITLCLDFPNQGAATLELLRALDGMTRERGGAIYPAKDAAMAPASFKEYYPQLKTFLSFRDPRFSSSLWRRVMEG